MTKDFNEMTINEKIQFICVFLPILCTIAWGIAWISGDEMNSVVTAITDVLLIVGLIGTLVFIVLTDILSFLKFVFSTIAKGWTIGMAICPIFPICFLTAFFGFAIAFIAVCALCTMLPVALTVYYYFLVNE